MRNEAGQRLIEFCQENTLVIENTLFQQHKRRLYIGTSPDGQHWNQIIFFAAKDGEALCSQQKQDQELTVAQIMNSLLPKSDLNWRKWVKTTRPFRYDLNQIPYDYTVEVRFKGLDLIKCLMNYGQTEVRDIVQEARSKTIPKKRNSKKAKWLSEEALQITVSRREVNSKG